MATIRRRTPGPGGSGNGEQEPPHFSSHGVRGHSAGPCSSSPVEALVLRSSLLLLANLERLDMVVAHNLKDEKTLKSTGPIPLYHESPDAI